MITHSFLVVNQLYCYFRKKYCLEVISISIRQKRTEAKMTQAELAKELGVYQSAITQWENGLTSPRLDKLQAMAALFKCSIDELVRKEESIDGQP